MKVVLLVVYYFSTNIDLMLDLHELWCRFALELFYVFFPFHVSSIPIDYNGYSLE
jgi:hypothetical protein